MNKLDQADYLAKLDELTAKTASLEAAMRAAGKAVPARPAAVHDDVILNAERLESHVARLTAECSLAGIKATVTTAAPAAASHSWAAGVDSIKAAVPHMTATERCKVAKKLR